LLVVILVAHVEWGDEEGKENANESVMSEKMLGSSLQKDSHIRPGASLGVKFKGLGFT
jgi:hypothetical protein